MTKQDPQGPSFTPTTKPKRARTEKDRAYYREHREECLARGKAWREKNREKIRAQEKAYRAANRDKINAAERKRRAANPSKWTLYRKTYRLRHPPTEAQRAAAREYSRAWRLARRTRLEAEKDKP